MPSFQQHYRSLFAQLGYPLKKSDGTPPGHIVAAEKRLGVKVSAALRDYYLVAGRERRFNRCFNRFLPPTQWWVDGRKLLFLEENQAVVWWGVPARAAKSDDPAVYQGVNCDPITWFLEHRKCSVFLVVILHYHAVSDGFPVCCRGDAPEKTACRFERNGWTFHGEVNGLKAYSRPNQAVCLMPPGDLPFMQRWSVLAGTKSRADMEALGEELGVALS